VESLDALLNQGAGRFTDITARLRDRLTRTLGDHEARDWLRRERTLDAALADTVTLAADDVLLPQLLATLTPAAWQLLIGLAVYREPVDLNAVLFQAGQHNPDAAGTFDPAPAQKRIRTALADQGLDADSLGRALDTGALHTLPADPLTAIPPDLAELNAPPRSPFTPSDRLHDLLTGLTETTLLTA